LSLSLRNVWGGPDPEAVVRTATCGNRCDMEVYVAITKPRAGRVLFHDFGGGSPGPYAWRGQSRGGRFEFVSYDQRFFCFFASCASSSVPPQVLVVNSAGTAFADVTRSRPDIIAADAAMLW